MHLQFVHLLVGFFPAIISTEIFKAVQIEKEKRSNVTAEEDGAQRKGIKYSSKK